MQKSPHRAGSVIPGESAIGPIRYLPRHVPVPSSGVASGAATTHGRTACSARDSRRPGPPVRGAEPHAGGPGTATARGAVAGRRTPPSAWGPGRDAGVLRRGRAACRRSPAVSRGGGARALPAVGRAGRCAGARVDLSREFVFRVCRSAALHCPFFST